MSTATKSQKKATAGKKSEVGDQKSDTRAKKSAGARTVGAAMANPGMTGTPQAIAYDLLKPGHNARKEFAKDRLEELAESIAQNGLKSRLIVYPGKDGKFVIHGGERRYRAIGMLIKEKRWSGLVPCEVQVEAPESEREVVGLIENLMREDLSPAEKARGVKHAIETGGFVAWDEKNPARSMGHKLGFKSKSSIYGLIMLADLCKLAQEALQSGEIKASVAEQLARIRDPKLQAEATQEAIHYRWTDERAASVIAERYQRQLKGAPFDVKDADLVPRSKDGEFGGPCATCSQRSGNQAEMFGEFAAKGRGDMCLRPACFAAKCRAAGDIRMKEHAANGGRVLTADEATKAGLTQYYSHPGGAWLSGDLKSLWVKGGVEVDFAKVTAQLVKDGKIKPVLARANDGSQRIFELYPRKEVEALIAELPEVKEAAAKRKADDEDEDGDSDYEARREQDEKLASAQRQIVTQKLYQLPIERLIDLLAEYHCGNYDFDAEGVLARRGWAVPEPGDDESEEEMSAEGRALLAKMRETEPIGVMQMFVEGLMMPNYMRAEAASKDPNWLALCKVTGTTPEAVWMGAREACGIKETEAEKIARLLPEALEVRKKFKEETGPLESFAAFNLTKIPGVDHELAMKLNDAAIDAEHDAKNGGAK